MKVQITAQGYHLRYLVDEDRILLSVDLSAEQELGMSLTRRLTRNLVTALAKLVADRDQAAKSTTPLMHETILDFQHGASVASAVAEGNMRDETKTERPPPPSKLVREVKLAPRQDGGLGFMFDDGERLLTLDVSPDRIHMVIETFVQMAERAGWDFPPIASWIGASKSVVAPANKVLN